MPATVQEARLMSAETQTPPVDIHHTMRRLRDSNVASVQRASGSLLSGLGVLKNHLELPKTSKWQGESAWILDGIRASAIDGLDLKKSLGYAADAENHSDKVYVSKASRQAKQALLSTASPIGAAVALTKNLNPLVSKCNEILEGLSQVVQQERATDRDGDRAMERASPKDKSGPSKKGI